MFRYPAARNATFWCWACRGNTSYVRNLNILAGRFFDDGDTRARNKVGLITQTLANTLYGSQDAAIGQQIKLSGLPFTVIGTFKERVDTFGESEISDNTILIPYTVAQFFTANDKVKQLFFSVSDSAEVPRATEEIHDVLQSRHRPESVYKVYNLTQLLSVAAKTANTLTTVLLLISVFTLLVSGVGIMNIMLATVNSRIREIGVRKAVGATNAEIRAQFLTEAILISLAGGFVWDLHRPGAALLDTIHHQLPRTDLGLVGHHRGGGFQPGRRDIWYRARCPGRESGSGGKPALRIVGSDIRNLSLQSRCEVAGDVQDELRQASGVGIDIAVARGHDRHV